MSDPIPSTDDLKAAVDETQRVYQRALEDLREHKRYVQQLAEDRDAAHKTYRARVCGPDPTQLSLDSELGRDWREL